MEKQYTLFTQRVIDIVKAIPSGETLSYGDVARLAGSPRGARQVVRILSTLSEKHQLPWHRVLNRNGRISLPGASGLLQQALLANEGLTVSLEKETSANH